MIFIPFRFFWGGLLYIFRARLVKEATVRNTETLRSYVMVKNGKKVYSEWLHVANVSVAFSIVELELSAHD